MRSPIVPCLALAALAASSPLVAQVALPQPLLSQVAPDEQSLGEDLATDGQRIVVSGVSTDVDDPRVLIYEQVAGQWTVTKTWSPAGAAVNSGFGHSVDVDGDIVVAGAPSQLAGGRAWVLERIDGDWVETMLTPPDQVSMNKFGVDVGVSGGRVLVTHQGAGHAHVFEKLAGAWTAVAVLQPSVSHPSFGRSAAIDGDRAIVGAPSELFSGLGSAGAAYAFEFDGASWSQKARLISQSPVAGGAFGSAVDVSGDRLAVGEPGTGAGRVRPFILQAGTWQPLPTLQEPWPINPAYFGCGLALDGAQLLVGTSKGLNAFTNTKDRMHLFEDAGAGFVHEAEFRGPLAIAHVVALSGDVAVCGGVPASGNSRYEILDLANDTWLDLGSAHPTSALPPPRLYGFGSLQAGASCTFEMEGFATDNAKLGFFIAVGGANPVPFHGGTLQAAPVVLFLTMPVQPVFGSTGIWQLKVPFTMLPGLQGLDFVVQCAVKVNGKLALSNAIQGHVP